MRQEIWWQVYPLGFLGAERERLSDDAGVHHRLRGLEPWLDYLISMGANGLLLGPVFASETHGYDTVDHYRVDARLGTVEDLTHLIAECHARGIRVLLDGVFNHVGRSFHAFADVRAKGLESAYAGWFDLEPDPGAPDGIRADVFEGHGQLVTLNHGSDAVVRYVTEVMMHWLDAGVDGWRLDAAYAVPTGFWRRVAERVRERHPQAWLVGEVIHGDYVDFVRESTLDSVTQYQLWKATWSSLNERNLHELSWALQRHDEMAEVFQPLTFVGNHDVTRIASRLEDLRHLDHALVVLFTVPGSPCVYAGDEQAFRGVKEERFGGDDAIRPAFPASPAELSPLGEPVFERHRELIALRRRHPWLAGAGLEVLDLDNTWMAYRVNAGDEALVVALSLADSDLGVPVGEGFTTVEAGAGRVGGGTVTLAPHGWAVLGR